jgi:Lrp/AsnC family transcriptional regulator
MPQSSIELDLIDRGILNLLQRDASVSTAEIASHVGLSMSPCWRRIRRLETLGVVSGRVALLDQHRLGLEVTVFASVRLSAHGRQSLPEFESAIESLPEVIECYVMSGDVDYLLHVVTWNIRSYENFLRNHLLQLPTVREVHSQIALSQVKYTTQLPIDRPSESSD